MGVTPWNRTLSLDSVLLWDLDIITVCTVYPYYERASSGTRASRALMLSLSPICMGSYSSFDHLAPSTDCLRGNRCGLANDCTPIFKKVVSLPVGAR